MDGVLGALPPGLAGYVAADQNRRANEGAQLQQIQGILGMQGILMQQAAMQQKQQSLAQFAQQLPPDQRAAFMLSPDTFIKDQFGAYNLRPGEVRMRAGQPIAAAPAPFNLRPGEQRFNGVDSTPIASAPMTPTLAQVPVPGQPGVSQPTWLRPGEATGTPVGGMKMPEILNPAVQAAKQNVAAAGASRIQNNVNAFTPASVTAQNEFMKSTRTTYDQLKQAPVMLDSIEAAKKLIPGAAGFMGPGGESLLSAAKFLNNRLGTSISTEGVKDAEELRTRIFFNIMDNLKKMDAQPSQQQQQIMQEALGRLGTDPNALPRVLDAFADVIKGKVSLHNDEVLGAEQRGVKFPYDPVIRLPQSAPSAGGAVRKYNPKTGRIE